MDQPENVQQLDSVEVLKHEGALSLIMKAEIDTQIATAQAFPRSIKKFLDRTMSIATVNPEVAQACAYALPRGKRPDGSDNILEGPSVRLAEIVVSSYGNIRAGMRVIHNDGETITAQGICHDLETNTCITLEVKRSILQHEYVGGRKTGRKITMTQDMQVVTGNAACAIAFRNAVFKIVPTALIQDVYERVKEVAKGTAETMPALRQKALDFLHGIGVTDEKICAALRLQDVADIDLEKLSLLRGMVTLIKNQESTIADLFPDPKPKPPDLNQNTIDALKNSKKGGRPSNAAKAAAAAAAETDQSGNPVKVEPK